MKVQTSTQMACAGEERRRKGGGRVTQRKSDGNRCGDSTYGGRPPSAKVAAVW